MVRSRVRKSGPIVLRLRSSALHDALAKTLGPPPMASDQAPASAPSLPAAAFTVISHRVVRASELTRGPWDPQHQHAGPPIALRFMKENLNRAQDIDLRTCLAMEADRMVRCSRTEDHRAAVEAFLNKRTPELKGE